MQDRTDVATAGACRDARLPAQVITSTASPVHELRLEAGPHEVRP